MKGGARYHPPKVPPLEADRIRELYQAMWDLRKQIKELPISKRTLQHIIHRTGAYK